MVSEPTNALLVVSASRSWARLPENFDGGWGPKVELNPKPIKIPILGQFGTLKNYIYIKHGTLKNTLFFLFKHRHNQEELQLYRSSFTASHASHSCC